MKAPDIPEGFQFVGRGSSVEITCMHPGCHESTTAATKDDARAKGFIDKHRALHGGGA